MSVLADVYTITPTCSNGSHVMETYLISLLTCGLEEVYFFQTKITTVES